MHKAHVTGVLYTRETAISPFFFTMKRVLRDGNTCFAVLLLITEIRVTRIRVCIAIKALNCKVEEVSFRSRSECVDISMTNRTFETVEEKDEKFEFTCRSAPLTMLFISSRLFRRKKNKNRH